MSGRDRESLELGLSILAGAAVMAGPPELTRLALERLRDPGILESLHALRLEPAAFASVVIAEWEREREGRAARVVAESEGRSA